MTTCIGDRFIWWHCLDFRSHLFPTANDCFHRGRRDLSMFGFKKMFIYIKTTIPSLSWCSGRARNKLHVSVLIAAYKSVRLVASVSAQLWRSFAGNHRRHEVRRGERKRVKLFPSFFLTIQNHLNLQLTLLVCMFQATATYFIESDEILAGTTVTLAQRNQYIVVNKRPIKCLQSRTLALLSAAVERSS